MSCAPQPNKQKQRAAGRAERARGATFVEYALLVALLLIVARAGISALADVAKPFCKAETWLRDSDLAMDNKIGWFIDPTSGKGYCKRTFNQLQE